MGTEIIFIIVVAILAAIIMDRQNKKTNERIDNALDQIYQIKKQVGMINRE